MDVRLPQLGEGSTSGTVVGILVSKGDKVSKDQTVLELENEKAVAPIPAGADGTVEDILVSVGDTVNVGQPIMKLSGGGDSGDSQNDQGESSEEHKPQSEQKDAQQPEREPQQTPSASSVSASTQAPAQAAAPTQVYQSPSGFPPPASPSVRKMARELGIDLTRVQGSESGGRITLGDVRNYIAALQAGAFQAPAQPAQAPQPKVGPQPKPLPDFSKWGEIDVKPASTLRKKIGEQMSLSWGIVPHVSQFDEADITSILALRKSFAQEYEKKGARLTVTVFVLKALVDTLQEFPIFNSTYDVEKGEIVYKKYFNIGIAVDTEAGLIVPVIKNVDKKSLLDLSLELQELAEKTRDRKVSLDDLQGGTFTVSNQGSIGGGHFTPIVNHPEVAILGLGRGGSKLALNGKQVESRSMLPISLSYDHRVIDGGSAARFARTLAEALENYDKNSVALEKPKGAAKKKTASTKKKSVAKSRKG